MVEGLVVGLRFEMKAKKCFSLNLFLKSDGSREISGARLLSEFNEERTESPMDYIEPRTGFTGRVTAMVKSPSELQRAVESFEMFNRSMSYPPEYEKNLRAAVGQDRNPSDYDLELEVE